MAVIDATVGGVASNSYATLAEAATYFDERIPLPTPWVASGDASIRALIMATRLIGAWSVRSTVIRMNGTERYYYTAPVWTGAPATTTQRLAWPRTGMTDRNGNEIPSNVIPLELKEAQAELAGQLLMSDTTLDNTVAVSGITSVKAGSVSVSFKDMIERHVFPLGVLEMLPASWFTDEVSVPLTTALFDVVS